MHGRGLVVGGKPGSFQPVLLLARDHPQQPVRCDHESSSAPLSSSWFRLGVWGSWVGEAGIKAKLSSP